MLHEKIDLTHYPSNEWEAVTATHIFKDNAVLCNELSERLVQNFVHALELQNVEESKVPYLEFLQTIAIIDGHEVKKCQDMIIAEIINSDVMSFSSDKTYIDELCLLMQKQQPQSSEELAGETAIGHALAFHVNLIKVLIACTVGKNTFTEIKCHTVLSLEDIEKVVTAPHCLLGVKATYVHFLYHCHVDTENETKEIFTQPYIWSIFEGFVRDMSLVAPGRCEPDYADRALEAYCADNVVEVIAGFFAHTQFNQIPQPHVRAPIYKALYAKCAQLYHCAWLSEAQKANVAQALQAMQDKASVLGCADMPSLRHLDAVAENLEVVGRSLQQQNPRSRFLSLAASSAAATTGTTFHESRSGSLTSANAGSTPVLAHPVSRMRRSTLNKQQSLDAGRHDTRYVNEAFQDAVVLLEKGFGSKMQAEMLVLVDVLHKPASIFTASSTFRANGQDKHFIGK